MKLLAAAMLVAVGRGVEVGSAWEGMGVMVVVAVGGGVVTDIAGFAAAITLRSLWALEILFEEGFRFDSSIFPIRHHRYGIPGFRTPRNVLDAEIQRILRTTDFTNAAAAAAAEAKIKEEKWYEALFTLSLQYGSPDLSDEENRPPSLKA